MHGPAGSHVPSAAELDVLESRFMSNLVRSLEDGHYKMLTKGEWDAAMAEDFLLTLPVKVNYDTLDDIVIPNTLWKDRPDDRKIAPGDIADRILIFHRGVDVAQISG